MRSDTWCATVALFLATATGCSTDEDDDPDATASVGETGSSGDATDPSATMTAGMTGPMTGTTAGMTTVGDTATTADSSGEVPPEPGPNGTMCEENEECISGFCYYNSALGGICGDCNTDADCEGGGCSLPNPLAQPPTGAVCNMGEPGAGCMSDEVCEGDYTCATILEIPGIFEAATCSECITDADCDGGQLCSPSYDVLNISGQRVCVDAGSVANGEGCDHLGTGDDACTSGLCAVVDIMTLLQLGVCGDCGVDADCTAPEVCLEADIDITTGVVTPPTCGAA